MILSQALQEDQMKCLTKTCKLRGARCGVAMYMTMTSNIFVLIDALNAVSCERTAEDCVVATR